MASPTDKTLEVGAPLRPSAQTIAACLVLACALQLAENLLPKIPLFPWLKLGLSHLILLPFLLCFGALPATALALSRSLLTWMVAGTPLTSLMVGILAGMVSIAVVGGLLRPWVSKGWLGWIGLGVASATAHNLMQLAIVEFLLVDHAGFYFQLAPLVIWSLISGTVTALMAAAATPFWQRLFSGQLGAEWERMHSPEALKIGLEKSDVIPQHSVGPTPWGFYLGLLVLGIILAIPWWQGQIGVWFGIFVFALWPQKIGGTTVPLAKRFRGVWRPMKSTWPLLVFMAWLHLFHGEGHLLGWGGMTREGVIAFTVHAFRLLNLAALGPRLLPFFPKGWLQRSTSPFAQGILLALPALAGLPAAVPGAAKQFGLAWRKRGWGGFSEGLMKFSSEVMRQGLAKNQT